jgi:hypothetical protein
MYTSRYTFHTHLSAQTDAYTKNKIKTKQEKENI